MDSTEVEDDVIDIERISTVDDDDSVLIEDETTYAGGYDEDNSSEISHSNLLGTGNLLSQFFNIIANVKEKAYWKLNNSEINSLNNTCPKILPNVIKEHAGIISCALSLFNIIIKRLKKDSLECKMETDDVVNDVVSETEQTGLTGARTG